MINKDPNHKHQYDAAGRQLCCTQEEKIYAQAGAKELLQKGHSHDDGHNHDGHDHDHDGDDHDHDDGLHRTVRGTASIVSCPLGSAPIEEPRNRRSTFRSSDAAGWG